MPENHDTPSTFPALRASIAALMLGPQTWINKRLWQVLAFALREFERIQTDGPADYEYFERLCVMHGEALLLARRHLESTAGNRHMTDLLFTIFSIFDHGYDELVRRFGVPGLMDATDTLALTKAIFYHLEGMTVDEAHTDAKAIREMYAEAAQV